MKYIPRTLESEALRAARGFPALVLTGSRRAGKTSMLRHLFPGAQYCLLEDPEMVGRVRADPRGFLDELTLPAILDEIQNVPELFAYIRARIDRHPRRMGQWFITGSQDAPLMQGVTDSMAGRAAILQLFPFSSMESARVSLLHGGYPEVLARTRNARQWFSSYLQTYLERDVRAITVVRDLSTFRRFLALLASRHGQMLNKTDLACPLGVSVPTIAHWLGVLEATQQILIVPPYFENLGKRLVKSPKIYLADSGLACHLLGIDTAAELAKSPHAGFLFEGLIAGEIVKAQVHAGRRRELYYFRDEQGLEVDFMIPGRKGTWMLVECKAGKTVVPSMANPLLRLKQAMVRQNGANHEPRAVVVHHPSKTGGFLRAIAPGVEAMPWPEFVKTITLQNSQH